MSVATVSRADRRQLVRELLAGQVLSTQREVADALAERGVECDQATVSRDLDAVGAVKVRGVDGRLAYRLRADLSTDPGTALHATLHQYVTDVVSSGNLVVLRTPPACAHPVASAIDLGGLDDVIATVAGDDTVIVVAAEGVAGSTLADWFRDVLKR